jgi:GntR family transcriptional repressor for pyruvate dehydrogenase complex
LNCHVPASPRSTVFAPVDAPSTLAHTLERLGTAIRIGLLAPGSRLPPERELADQLGISRSTLRQALSTLTEQGHLRAVRGRSGGTFVVEKPPLASATPFPLEDTRMVLDWRMTLELGVVQLAAERATDEQREALREAAAIVPEDWAAFRRSDAAFHLSLAEAANSDRVVAAMTQVQGEISDLFACTPIDQTSLEVALDQHSEVAAAVVDGDGERARAAMRTHLEYIEQLLGERLG